MDITVQPLGELRGTLNMPGDKSISHRAFMFNAIADGTAEVSDCGDGADVLTTIECLTALGVAIEPNGENRYVVRGGGMFGLREPTGELDAGNSGTTIRLMSGILAGRDLAVTLTGDASLRTRPMGRIIQPLQQMGAKVSGADGDKFAPLRFGGGRLVGFDYDSPVASAQVKSCLLLAGLRADGEVVFREPMQTRNHTEKMLMAMGAKIAVDGRTVRVQKSDLRAVDVAVPGDISAAVIWAVGALIHPDAELKIVNVGLNETRTAALDLLLEMGANIEFENRRDGGGEPVADLVVRSSALTAFEVSGHAISGMIDELPALALAAVFADGTSTIRDAAELRHKESDRIHSTCDWLKRCGVKHTELPDGLTIEGRGELTGAVCETHHDHRIAMVLAVAGLSAKSPMTVLDAEIAKISYANFLRDLRSVSGDGD